MGKSTNIGRGIVARSASLHVIVFRAWENRRYNIKPHDTVHPQTWPKIAFDISNLHGPTLSMIPC